MIVQFDAVSAWIIRAIDGFTELMGKVLAWACLAMVIVMGAVVIMRYAFQQNSIAVQEVVTYFHGAVFMLGAAFTLKANEHVRVDIFFQRFSPKTQAWVNVLGTALLLMPVCFFILVISWDYVALSWRVQETSREAGGLGGVYFLKSLILLMPVCLILQGIAEILRNIQRIAGNESAHMPKGAPHA